MATKPLTDEQLRETLDVFAQHGTVLQGAEALGIPRSTFEARLFRARAWAKKNGVAVPSASQRRAESQATSLHVKGDTAELSRVVPTNVRTLADLVRVCEIDAAEWEIERWTCNVWHMASMPRTVGSKKAGWSRPSTDPIVTPLYQVKAWMRRRVALVAAREEIAALVADAKRAIPRRSAAVAVKRSASGNLLEPSIPDLHVGKLAWAQETGWENYDGKLAERVFEEALATLLQRTSSYTIDRILLPIGNDLLHADTKAGTTTGGTPLDMDSRYHKSFALVRRMMTRAVDTLRGVAPVRVVVVPGNHDTLSAWHLGDSLECYFHNCKDVEIDNAPTMRKYYQWGRVMLMFTHGNKGKLADYPMVMASEQPKMFGATLHREAHTGDKHQLKVQEVHGVKVRISPALCPPDAWHSEHHFVGNARCAEAFVWNRDEGLIGTANFTVKAPEKRGSSAA